MEYARGFDRPMALVFMSLLSTCAAAGGFVWQWGADKQSCTAACSDAGLVCVEGGGEPYSKIDSQAAFEAASDGSVSCPSGYAASDGSIGNISPCNVQGTCYWQAGSAGICAGHMGSPHAVITRLCSCTCAAGSFSPSDTQPYPCTRYDKIPTLPSHLRLRKARPTQLFLSLFVSSHNRAFAFFRV